MMSDVEFHLPFHTVLINFQMFLLTAHNMELSILTCRISNKYLHRLQTKLPHSGIAPVVHRYGTVDMFNTAQRVEAVRKIYKSMLDQVVAHLKESRAFDG